MDTKNSSKGQDTFDIAPHKKRGERISTTTPAPRSRASAREIIKPSTHLEVGVVNAPWLLAHPVAHESHLERRFIMIALACPAVINIEHQPEKIEIQIDNVKRRYTPDFRVTLASGEIIICEIKPHKFLKKTSEKRDAAQEYYKQKGIEYQTITEKQIDVNERAARAILLMRYGRIAISANEAQQCKKLLEQEASGSLRVAALLEHGISESVIWHMVATHALKTRTPLNSSDSEPIQINQVSEDCHVQFVNWFSTEAR